MNVRELSNGTNGTLPHYFEVAAPLTFLTVWVVMASRANTSLILEPHFGCALCGPWMLFKQVFMKPDKERERGEGGEYIVG